MYKYCASYDGGNEMLHPEAREHVNSVGIRKNFLVSEENQSLYEKGDKTVMNCIKFVIKNPAQY